MTNFPPGTRVLIVEDEAIIAMSAEDMIEAIGGIVAGCAVSLAEAFELLETIEFDVALLDINLNGETSFALADRLADSGRPFAFASGYGETILPAGREGTPMIGKPYRAEALAAALARALG